MSLYPKIYDNMPILFLGPFLEPYELFNYIILYYLYYLFILDYTLVYCNLHCTCIYIYTSSIMIT